MTADEALKELDGVTELFLFGLYLGVPQNDMKAMKSSMVIHKWLEMGKASCTWQKLVDALVGIKQCDIAHKIAAKYGNIHKANNSVMC